MPTTTIEETTTIAETTTIKDTTTTSNPTTTVEETTSTANPPSTVNPIITINPTIASSIVNVMDTSTQTDQTTLSPDAPTIPPQSTSAPLSYQPVSCSPVLAGETLSCDPSATSSAIPAPLDSQVASLLDDNTATCFQPYDGRDVLVIVLETADIQLSQRLKIEVTGEGLDCLQPSTLVAKTLNSISSGVKQRECPHIETLLSGVKTTCVYLCNIIQRCGGPTRITLQFRRIVWLPRSNTLSQLCDIRAFIFV